MKPKDSPQCSEVRARVVETFGRRMIVQGESGERLPAEIFGKRLACVCGDWVQVRLPPIGSNDVARVTKVEARRTLFARTDSRGRTEHLAANLSLLVVIIAPEPEPDGFVADRYLAGAAFAGLSAIVVANKSELAAARTAEYRQLIDAYRRAGYHVIALSAHDPPSIESLRAALQGHSAMLVGQSGVGKSTLTNQLVPNSARPTRTLSDASGEGRHTTVSTALFEMPGGGELVDSPGVRDYAPPLLEDAAVQNGWAEIVALAPTCRFHNCLHLREPGCAVLAAVAQQRISPRRYESYKRLVNIMRGLAPEYERKR